MVQLIALNNDPNFATTINFNSTMVQLIVVILSFVFRGVLLFQFYYGSINRATKDCPAVISRKFQFYYGSINSFIVFFTISYLFNFNSTMVQLIALQTPLLFHRLSYFNSTMVQLIAALLPFLKVSIRPISILLWFN